MRYYIKRLETCYNECKVQRTNQQAAKIDKHPENAETNTQRTQVNARDQSEQAYHYAVLIGSLCMVFLGLPARTMIAESRRVP